jgi:LCP family protein required for cell wall assembly
VSDPSHPEPDAAAPGSDAAEDAAAESGPAPAATKQPRPPRGRTRPAPARHGRKRRASAWGAVAGLIAAVVAVALVSTTSVAAIAAWQLEQNVEENIEPIPADTELAPPSIGEYEGGFNILIVGTDTRRGQKGIGGDESSELNDVTMLLHVAEDQKSATLVSIPRDMVVPMPPCKNGGGAAGLPINNALYYGGLDCVVRTVEALSGLTIQFAGMISFTGVIKMTNAVGGVEVCTTGRIDDSDTGLHLSKGTHTLKGFDALAFLRSRHGVGDGSDLGRISSQQVYLSSLVRKMKSDSTLNDFGKLYNMASAATKNISLSKNFSKLDTLVSIALVLKNIPLDNIVMVQYPGTTGGTGLFAGKVQPDTALADRLFSAIRKDKPIKLDKNALDGNHGGSTLDPKAKQKEKEAAEKAAADAAADEAAGITPTPDADDSSTKKTEIPGLKGQPADQYTCSQPYSG